MNINRRKHISFLLVLLMLLMLIVPVNAQAGTTNDYTGNWAEAQLKKWIEKGILVGYSDGIIKPDNTITRAELVALLDRVCRLTDKSESVFTDVKSGAWYADSVYKAVVAKAIVGYGNGEFRPDNMISRQEAAVVFAKLFNLQSTDTNALSEFRDVKSISNWSKEAISALVEKGYLNGRLGKLISPLDNLTRAEFIIILDRIAGDLINTVGTYNKDTTGNLTVNISDVVLNDMTINGDLFITQGIGDGYVTLNSVKVIGRTVVKGGGENSIVINSSSLQGPLIVLNADGTKIEKSTDTIPTPPPYSGGGSGNNNEKDSGDDNSNNNGEENGNSEHIPSIPKELIANSTTSDAINLSWDEVTAATDYNLYRSIAADGDSIKINREPLQLNAYTDKSLEPETTYYYWVTAVNVHGESDKSVIAIATTTPAFDAEEWKLIWSDEFNGVLGGGVDTDKWIYEIGGNGFGNNELQYYTDLKSNVYIEEDRDNLENGFLVIQADRESYGGRQYTSGRIKTSGKHEFKYGKVEMRAKLPYGQGMWPAFWMLGSNIGTVGWPNCGELDIMEFVGRSPNRVNGTIHGPNYSGGDSIGTWHEYIGGFTDDYHTYAIEWEPNVIRWYFDGQLYQQRTPEDLSGKEWVFNQDFYIILNLAVGGNWPGSPDESTIFPQKYIIDYVRVYQRTDGVYPDPVERDLIRMKNVGNDKFVCTDKQNNHYLYANRSTAGGWETFERVDLGDGNIALLSLVNYKYVSVSENGQLAANGSNIGATETFKVFEHRDSTQSLLCEANRLYVTVQESNILTATASYITNSEKLQFIDY